MPSDEVRERCKKLRVLVAEDDEDILDLILLVLKDLQVQTICKATDGAKAWDVFLQLRNQINVVICDWVMPPMEGLQVLRRIRDNKSDVRLPDGDRQRSRRMPSQPPGAWRSPPISPSRSILWTCARKSLLSLLRSSPVRA